MARIACEDLADPAMNGMLLARLRTADFLDTGHHPTDEFVAAAERLATCTGGTPNDLPRGTFTLRGIRGPLELPSPSGDALRAACGRLCRSAPFRVLVAAKDECEHFTGQGVLELDRTAYGSHYGSGELFRFLGQPVVNDHIILHVEIHAERQI